MESSSVNQSAASKVYVGEVQTCDLDPAEGLPGVVADYCETEPDRVSLFIVPEKPRRFGMRVTLNQTEAELLARQLLVYAGAIDRARAATASRIRREAVESSERTGSCRPCA